MPVGWWRPAPAADLFRDPQHPYTQGLLRSMPRLDEQVASELVTIPGQPPNLQALPHGCAFADRCPYVFERCRLERPRLRRATAPAHATRLPSGAQPVTAPLLTVRDLTVHFPIAAGGLLRRRFVPLKAVDDVSLRAGARRDAGHRRRDRAAASPPSAAPSCS